MDDLRKETQTHSLPGTWRKWEEVGLETKKTHTEHLHETELAICVVKQSRDECKAIDVFVMGFNAAQWLLVVETW